MKAETATNQMTAYELRDIMAKQLRSLNELDVNDKNAARKIDTAKQIFNGGGKIIALAAYVTEAHRVGTSGEILALPEIAKTSEIKLPIKNKKNGPK